VTISACIHVELGDIFLVLVFLFMILPYGCGLNLFMALYVLLDKILDKGINSDTIMYTFELISAKVCHAILVMLTCRTINFSSLVHKKEKKINEMYFCLIYKKYIVTLNCLLFFIF